MRRIERIVFFGTPEFALPALDALVAAGHAPCLVVSQPARPAGRGRRLLDPPVALRARELGLPLEQPAKVREPEFRARLAGFDLDLAVVVAFGQIFPRALLELPAFGCLNLHASLLPRWRGAAPIQAAIAAGDTTTGVCLMQMKEGLDSGPVLALRELAIGERETAGELSARLARSAAELLIESLPKLERGELPPVAQAAAGATYAPKLGGIRELSLEQTALEIGRAFRAATPEPGAALVVRGERIKLLDLAAAPNGDVREAGAVVGVFGDALRVGCGAGSAVDLARVVRPGGNPITGRDLANGLRLGAGDRVS